MDDVHGEGELGNTVIELVVEDSQADPGEAVAALRKLVTLYKTPVVMTVFTDIGLAQKPVAAELGVVLLSSGIQNPLFALDNPWVFRNALSYAWKADAFLRFLRDYAHLDLSGLRYAYVKVEKNVSMDRQAERLKRLAAEFGVAIVAEETLEEGSEDFDAQVARMRAAEPDVVHVMANGKVVQAFTAAMKQHGLAPGFLLLGGDVRGSAEPDLLSNTDANGLIYAEPQRLDEEADLWAERFTLCYEPRAGREPDDQAASFYDGVLVLAEAVKRGADPADPVSMRDHLAQLDEVAGLSGRWAFSPGGDAWVPLGIGQIQEGRFVEVVPRTERFLDVR